MTASTKPEVGQHNALQCRDERTTEPRQWPGSSGRELLVADGVDGMCGFASSRGAATGC